MNENIIKEIAIALNIKNNQVSSVLKLLNDGNTVAYYSIFGDILLQTGDFLLQSVFKCSNFLTTSVKMAFLM